MACYISIDGCYDLPKKEPKPEFAATGDSGSNGSAGAGYAENVGVDGYYIHPKEEPEPELDIGDGGAVDVDGYYDCDPPKDEPEFVDFHNFPLKQEAKPELVTASDDAVADGGRDFGSECSHCGIGLSSQEFKVEHELRCKIHMEQKELESQVTKLYHCGYCKCPFLNKEYRELHQQKWCRKRPVVARKCVDRAYFKCPECEYVTAQKYSLDRHLLTHNKKNAEWFTCTQCSYKTVHKYAMTRHMKIHGNTFSCCCPICGKSFRTKRCLDDHLLKQHSDETDEVSKLITSKIYTCDICNQYRTIKKTDFNDHVTITHHKGVGCQKYECPCCSYSTFYKSNLKTHSKMHLKQKDYRCTVCKKSFSHKQGLDSHVLYKHSDDVDLVKTITSKIHRCELCPFKAVLLTHLKGHVQSKHI